MVVFKFLSRSGCKYARLLRELRKILQCSCCNFLDTNCYFCQYYCCFCIIVLATSGEEGRKSIMKEIGLGKELGDSPQENIVQFIGCVTTQSKRAILCLSFENCDYFSLLFVCVVVCIDKNKY